MGAGRSFSWRRGALGYFSKIFPGGVKSGEICFFPVEIKKTTLVCLHFQNPEGVLPPPSDAHDQKCLSLTAPSAVTSQFQPLSAYAGMATVKYEQHITHT